LLQAIEDRDIDYNDIINSIFDISSNDFSKGRYNLIVCLLTISDMIPSDKALDMYQATAYYFCLQVNMFSAYEGGAKALKTIPSSYLALRTAQLFNWDYAEYLNSDESVEDNVEETYFEFSYKFNYILNEFTFKIPVTQVKQGFFRKKTGYMLSKNAKAYGRFTIGNDMEVHRIYKSDIIKLIEANLKNGHSYIYDSYHELLFAIDRTGSAAIILETLAMNGFFGACSFTKQDSKIWVDDDDDCLYVEGKTKPDVVTEAEEDNCPRPIGWAKVRDYLYKAIPLNSKLYVSYINNNDIYLLSS
ncbi:MAG: hypothetical protein VZS44_10345, partial [Bacilli bacterium]|nr:hypothetical protein [Bacilli bacterium]